MRIIKFRAWDNHKGAWCKDGEILLTLDGDWRSNFGEHEDGIELQQFTGLLDKNEKEIYEGDILSGRNKNDSVIVIFEKGCFQMNNGFELKHGIPHRKVIGNIYENPELLK